MLVLKYMRAKEREDLFLWCGHFEGTSPDITGHHRTSPDITGHDEDLFS